MIDETAPEPAAKPPSGDTDDRRAAALRANLAKRKAQQRARGQWTDPDPPSTDD